MKKSIRKIFTCTLAIFLVTLQPISAYALGTLGTMCSKVNYEVAVKVGLESEADTIRLFQGMCVTGTTAYAFKIESNETASRLYKITNIHTKNPTTEIVETYIGKKHIYGHANGVAFYSNHLYVTRNIDSSGVQVVKLGLSGNEIKKYKMKESDRKTRNKVRTITYFKSNKFIIDEGHEIIGGKRYSKFSVVTFDDSTETINYGNCFYINVDSYHNSGFTHYQDIVYDSGRFYLPIHNGNANSRHKNVVIAISLNDNVVNEKKYPVQAEYIINGEAGNVFEMEGLGFGKDGYKYFTVNKGNRNNNALCRGF